jgi:hypothetical protein
VCGTLCDGNINDGGDENISDGISGGDDGGSGGGDESGNDNDSGEDDIMGQAAAYKKAANSKFRQRRTRWGRARHRASGTGFVCKVKMLAETEASR